VKQVFSHEAPLPKVVLYQWVCCALVSEILKDEFQTVLAVFVLDIVVQAIHILDASHALNSKKQICKKAAFLFLVQLDFLWLLVIEFVVSESVLLVALGKRVIFQRVFFVVVIDIVKSA